MTRTTIAREVFELTAGLTEEEFEGVICNVRACRFADVESRFRPLIDMDAIRAEWAKPSTGEPHA